MDSRDRLLSRTPPAFALRGSRTRITALPVLSVTPAIDHPSHRDLFYRGERSGGRAGRSHLTTGRMYWF